MKSIFTFIFSALSLALVAQRNFDGVQIEPVKVSDHVYVLFGSGGNIALVTGENQNYIIDDQFAPLSDKIEFAIQTINPKPIAYVLLPKIRKNAPEQKCEPLLKRVISLKPRQVLNSKIRIRQCLQQKAI